MDPLEYLTLWHAWLRSMRFEEFALVMWPFVLLEVPRYVLSKVVMLIVDVVRGEPKPTVYSHDPSVTPNVA